ncbi:barstar family protein [Listeria cossartiae subsp. cayugensis]|uniref:Barstar family protein n=1 Tax=Listeria cossartiae subsp. cayugensis TaxID=2713505 RepID=A0A7X0ZE31_9LIST|nr:barstar family protein [Listeria cossartiae]MBC2250452.1 barstar family protein [Listeria cossartiae subsp. cayugensis]MDT0003994.1 barstar family protein [Listeria cossartiae subsp. cayugensis]MDT0015053.1 barstar family protein [Listeria cossartiae subsp. cayugensis]MDT0020388.1 barstar family protein [Listeria cossartiae subsp. cayugensis]MDT0036397.1 barstar family protein [Listeria cossartiae subsp. cayugensis]
MTKNEILRVNTIDILELEKNAKKNECYIVNIQGNNIQTKKIFLELMAEKFLLPDSIGWDSFTDWMTDLSWIDNPCFCIIIKDYTDFLKKDTESKEIVMEIFKEDILPFWENGVTQTVVEGKPRSFKVYLVK